MTSQACDCKEEGMLKDLELVLEDTPGALALVGEILGRAAVNIEGICGMRVQGKGVVHILVSEATKARKALEVNRLQVTGEHEVLVMEVEDRPGNLGNIARRLAVGHININLAYLATSTRLVIGVDDLEGARGILKLK